MGSSVNFPTGRDPSPATSGVAALVAGLVLPSIEPLATDIACLADLPRLPDPAARFQSRPTGPSGSDPSGSGPDADADAVFVPECQLDGARLLMDQCAADIAALNRLQNRCAGVAARLLERFESAAAFEGTVLGLDVWAREAHLDGSRAEIASLLHLPEGVNYQLMAHAKTLVRDLPATMAVLEAGGLGWEHAVIIAQETALLRQGGIAGDTIERFEAALLGKAEGSSLPSFKEKARRLRERSYPETIPAKTRQAYTHRNLRISRAVDGMSLLSLWAPAPSIEGIWDQCTRTAQAAQGPHETRTLTQLRADVATALLLNQTMDENHIHTPPPTLTPTPAPVQVRAPAQAQAPAGGQDGGPWFAPVEPEGCAGGGFPDPFHGGYNPPASGVPHFDDPDYEDPGFTDPDVLDWNTWRPLATQPTLTPAPPRTPAPAPARAGTPPDPPANHDHPDGPGVAEATPAGSPVVWPPMPKVLPIILIPALSLLGCTNEPAWMEGVGPLSMDVAEHLLAQSSSFYRVLVDPISNEPLDSAPQRYRVTTAMRTMLAIRDEYCQFPGCLAKAATCDIDHLHAYEHGGTTTYKNLQHLCHRHHARFKHFKDDRTRTGAYRTDQSPDRAAITLRGWTPTMTETGVAWTSPAGYYYPPDSGDGQPPLYPAFLKNLINTTLEDLQTSGNWHDDAYYTQAAATIDQEQDWDPENLPEEPAWAIPNAEDNTILTEQAIADFRTNHPDAT
ncbi:DUF222 domain-containing protein [Arthrobacter sp. LAPM80]|uniref:HNH endonuclease signature motif containing protein n=1 Tax=Arthrobacter sp. LAPM80 TaxID=3141788 RepID=UPI00398AF8AD